MNLTPEQIEQLNKLWWVYGNSGKKCTLTNHKLIQGYLEANEDRLDFYIQGNINMLKTRGTLWVKSYGLTQECLDAVCKVLNREPIKLKLS